MMIFELNIRRVFDPYPDFQPIILTLRLLAGGCLVPFCLIIQDILHEILFKYLFIYRSTVREGQLNMAKCSLGYVIIPRKIFLPEIQDELVGYTNNGESEAILRALLSIKKIEFTIKDLSTHLQGEGLLQGHELSSILEVLFKCSAIGNIKHKFDGKTYWSFRFRNRHAQFNTNEKFILHRGLWKAMNVV